MLQAGHSLQQAQEFSSLYVLGSLSSDETEAFEKHLNEGCPVCEEQIQVMRGIVGELGWASLRAPVPGLRQRLLDSVRSEGSPASEHGPQVWKAWKAAPRISEAEGGKAKGWTSVRAGEGNWQDTGLPGIRVRHLRVDSSRKYVTMLVKMDPGSRYVPHRHHDIEECFVIDGELVVEDEVLGPGDYQVAEAGSIHGIQTTRTGCTLLIVSSTEDTLI